MSQFKSLKRALAGQELVVGHMVMEFAVPGIAALLKPLEPDFVLFDLEHTGLSLETLSPVLLSCRQAGLFPVVRVPGLSGHFISRCLDVGALGIMVPNVKTTEEAQAVVGAVKYPPEGRRGMGLGGAHTLYQPQDPAEYAAWANAETVVMLQIESTEALDNVDGIVAVPGVDVGWVGQLDLSLSMGIPGRYEDQRFLAALDRVVDACRRAGKKAGNQPGTVEAARRLYERGYSVLSLGNDIALYQRALGEGLNILRSFGR